MQTQRVQSHQLAVHQVDTSWYNQDDDPYAVVDDFSPEEEKHISVDPLSLNPAKFLSASLPCSTTSSPKNFTKCRAPDQALARQNTATLVRHHQPHDLRRSKSCGEGRACPPSDEFDILARISSSRFQKPQNAAVEVIYECNDNQIINPKHPKAPVTEQDFKCGALCLFLPGFAKKKHDQTTVERVSRVVSLEKVSKLASLERLSGAASLERVSRVASFEKFECGSWTESNIFDGGEDDDEGMMHSYFDLPLELIRSGGDDAESPVKAAFVYERDRKGVLKKSTSRMGRKSCESRRHVRFSTSTTMSHPPSPSSGCITPRLLKARDEFNALLEAQGA